MTCCDSFRPFPPSLALNVLNFLLIDFDDVQSIVVSGPYVAQHALAIFSHSFCIAGAARRFRAKLRRSFATVQDPPVRHYGGLKDQDRIFTNAYCRHDHGIKGAQVR